MNNRSQCKVPTAACLIFQLKLQPFRVANFTFSFPAVAEQNNHQVSPRWMCSPLVLCLCNCTSAQMAHIVTWSTLVALTIPFFFFALYESLFNLLLSVLYTAYYCIVDYLQ